MYFVELGMIWVIINYLEGGEEEVGCYGVGKYFGEFVFIENKFRFVNVYVIGKVKVVFLECDFFERFLGLCFDIMKRNLEIYKNYIESFWKKN